jgi:hypothetical protein
MRVLFAISGDQGDKATVESWVAKSGGQFHVIIDDGGHKNAQIKTSFDVLFEQALLPGGLYFIEDLQVGRMKGWGSDDSVGPMSIVIQA